MDIMQDSITCKHLVNTLPTKHKFSSGPCVKPSTWQPVNSCLLGRSHRSKDGLARIQFLMQEIREILEIPNEYYVGLIGGSSSGAMESLIWSLIGARGVDILNACVFSNHWENDIRNQLKIEDIRSIKSEIWDMTGFDKIDFARDLVFCWTGTTNGISVNQTDWIPEDREGLTICDAASAVFCSKLNWAKLDATAFSWQKGLGGEAGIGTIVLSPRAMQRLTEFLPNRPMPRIYRLAENGNINYGIFDGKTINTPSMMIIEDFIQNLTWARQNGGLSGMLDKVTKNYAFMKNWENSQNTYKFKVKNELIRAKNVLCFDITTDNYIYLSDKEKWEFLTKKVAYLETKNIYDILGHTATSPHIRVWCGPTIELDWLIYLTSQLENI